MLADPSCQGSFQAAASCYLCGQPARQTCRRCESVHFCSEYHASFHTLPDTGSCTPFLVKTSPSVGRQLVARRKIAAGEIICQEEPILVGPNQEGSAICLSCLAAVDLSYLCSTCGYPLCDQGCELDPAHAEVECGILARGPRPPFREQEADASATAYHVILPLRLLLLQDRDRGKGAWALTFMDHSKKRQKGEYWEVSEEHVTNRLRNSCNYTRFTQEEIQRAVGILEINSYELHSYGNTGYRGMFAIGSVLSHSCRANSRLIFASEPPFETSIMATVDIEQGEEITGSYVRPTTCALMRRPQLTQGWFFDCACTRCLDPTELGSHVNTVRCPACRHPTLGWVLPQGKDDWKCRHCSHKMAEVDIVALVEPLLAETDTLANSDRYNVSAWLGLKSRADLVLHPQHEVLCEVAKWVLPVLCRAPNQTLYDFPRHLVLLKAELATRYLNVLNCVEPGVGRNRAKTIVELVQVEMFLTTTDTRDGRLDHREAAIRVKGYLELLQQAAFIFSKLGVKTSFEGFVVHWLNQLIGECSSFLKMSSTDFGSVNES